MMRYSHWILAVGVLVGSSATPSSAGERIHRAWHSFWGNFHANNEWPDPYVCPDREAVRSPFRIMIQNGWRLQNTLTEHHFKQGTSELSENGRIKVRWILTSAPIERRMIFVQPAISQEMTQDRIASIYDLASEILPGSEPTDVLVNSVRTTGWPADYVDEIDRKFRDSTPEPRLPEAQRADSSN